MVRRFSQIWLAYKKNLYTTFAIELYYVSYFINYIYCELVTLWSSVMCEQYEKYYRKFGYKWKIMTLNQKKKKASHMCDEASIYIKELLILIYQHDNNMDELTSSFLFL